MSGSSDSAYNYSAAHDYVKKFYGEASAMLEKDENLVYGDDLLTLLDTNRHIAPPFEECVVAMCS